VVNLGDHDSITQAGIPITDGHVCNFIAHSPIIG
jgi:hypothetical protein